RELGPEARTTLLADADPEVRLEVISLLAQDLDRDMMQRPIMDVAADLLAEQTVTQLAVGVLLGPYKIEAPIGAGGMGEVFRATDTRLHRTVALKILPRSKVTDLDRKRRFLQEARAASALNHPNIVTLHDIASGAGTDYLVMEFVPG